MVNNERFPLVAQMDIPPCILFRLNSLFLFQGPVFSLAFCRNTLLSAGRDGIINSWMWNKHMDHAGQIQVVYTSSPNGVLNPQHSIVNGIKLITKSPP